MAVIVIVMVVMVVLDKNNDFSATSSSSISGSHRSRHSLDHRNGTLDAIHSSGSGIHTVGRITSIATCSHSCISNGRGSGSRAILHKQGLEVHV